MVLSNGDFVNISGVVGMTEVNNKTFKVADKATNTFELTDMLMEQMLTTTAFTTYGSGGMCIT